MHFTDLQMLPKSGIVPLSRRTALLRRIASNCMRADIVVQKNPDLDNIASSIALRQILRINFPHLQAGIYWNGDISSRYVRLVEQVLAIDIRKSFRSYREFDPSKNRLVFVTDTAEKALLPYDLSKSCVIKIDHHDSSGDRWWTYSFADHRYPSAGMVLPRMFLGFPTSPDIQRSIYLSLVADIGAEKAAGFRFCLAGLRKNQMDKIDAGFESVMTIPDNILNKSYGLGNNTVVLELSVAEQLEISPENFEDLEIRKGIRQFMVNRHNKDITIVVFEEKEKDFSLLIYAKDEDRIKSFLGYLRQGLGHKRYGGHDNRAGVMGLDREKLAKIFGYIRRLETNPG